MELHDEYWQLAFQLIDFFGQEERGRFSEGFRKVKKPLSIRSRETIHFLVFFCDLSEGYSNSSQAVFRQTRDSMLIDLVKHLYLLFYLVALFHHVSKISARFPGQIGFHYLLS